MGIKLSDIKKNLEYTKRVSALSDKFNLESSDDLDRKLENKFKFIEENITILTDSLKSNNTNIRYVEMITKINDVEDKLIEAQMDVIGSLTAQEKYKKELEELNKSQHESVQIDENIDLIININTKVLKDLNLTIKYIVPMWKKQILTAIGMEIIKHKKDLSDTDREIFNQLIKSNIDTINEMNKATKEGNLKDVSNVFIETLINMQDEISKVK